MHYLLKGLYLITDNKIIDRDRFIETVELAVSGGASILQLREKGTEPREIIKLGRQLLEITRRFGIPLIINDSPEIALETGAEGVHLGEEDPDLEYARDLLGSQAIIGVSCYHKIERGIEAVEKGANYLAFGTPYTTPTKPGRVPTSFETLKMAKSRFTDIPVFAIGGISPENASEVIETGVDGIAVITSVFGSENPYETSRNLKALFKK